MATAQQNFGRPATRAPPRLAPPPRLPKSQSARVAPRGAPVARSDMEDSAPAADEAAPMKKAPETVVMTPVEEDDAKVSMELQTNTPAPERFTKV